MLGNSSCARWRARQREIRQSEENTRYWLTRPIKNTTNTQDDTCHARVMQCPRLQQSLQRSHVLLVLLALECTVLMLAHAVYPPNQHDYLQRRDQCREYERDDRCVEAKAEADSG